MIHKSVIKASTPMDAVSRSTVLLGTLEVNKKNPFVIVIGVCLE